MAQTMTDVYSKVHLILSRLNSEWSINGTILSHHAQYLLRRDIDEGDMVASIRNLIDAWSCIITSAGVYLDEATSPLDLQGNAHSIQRWNSILAGASDMLLNDLIPAIDDEQKTLQGYIQKSFAKSQALKQPMG